MASALNRPRDLSTSCYVRFSSGSDGVTEDDINAVFAAYGAIAEVFAKLERGFAFVTFETAAAVADAVAGVTDIAGAAVTVEPREAKERERPPTPASANIYINQLSETTTRESIEDVLAEFGTVDRIKLDLDRGFCYASFADEEEAAAAVAAAPLLIDGVETGVEFRRSRAPTKKTRKPRNNQSGEAPAEAAPSTEVYIKGMPEEYDEEALSSWAAGIGAVASVEWPDASTTGHAFVTFEDAETAQAAIGAGDGFLVELRTSKRGRRRRR